MKPPRILGGHSKKIEKSYKFSQKSETSSHQSNNSNYNSHRICYLSLEQPQCASDTSGRKVGPATGGSSDPNMHTMYTRFKLGPAIKKSSIQAHVRADFSAVWPGSGRDVRNKNFLFASTR